MIQLKRLLLPTDFSESARHAFDYAVSFAREYEAELFLAHVVEVLPVGYTGDLFPAAMTQFVDEIAGYARTELGKLAEEARAAGLLVHERLEHGKPAAELIRLAREEHVDLIVIGTHGRGTLSHVLFGSTTDRVVRKAPCPVLICRLFERELVERPT
jgi:nucleotide-binding universal stress UspA family protein